MNKNIIENHLSPQFMLAEYERLSNLRINEVNQSANRVNFFLTILSVAIGGLVIMFQVSPIPENILHIGALFILIILLLFGIHTLNRLNSRNSQLIYLTNMMKFIQKYSADQDPELAKYFTKMKKELRGPKHSKIGNFIFKRLRGTLTDLIVLCDGVICGGISFIILNRFILSLKWISFWTILISISATIVIYAYHYYIQRKLSAFG